MTRTVIGSSAAALFSGAGFKTDPISERREREREFGFLDAAGQRVRLGVTRRLLPLPVVVVVVNAYFLRWREGDEWTAAVSLSLSL